MLPRVISSRCFFQSWAIRAMFAGFDIMFSHLLEFLFLLIVEIPRKIPSFFFPRNKTRTYEKLYNWEATPFWSNLSKIRFRKCDFMNWEKNLSSPEHCVKNRPTTPIESGWLSLTDSLRPPPIPEKIQTFTSGLRGKRIPDPKDFFLV